MKVLAYWHDMFLPHSAYLLRAFDQSPLIDKVVLLGPDTTNPEEIFNQTDEEDSHVFSEKTKLVKVRTYRMLHKCCTFGEYLKHIKSFQPDLILVIDEPLSLNVLLAGVACQKASSTAKVMFYGFENIYSGIPLRYFLDKPNLSRFLEMCKKTIRFLLIDKLLMPLRKKVIYGGLTSYQECTDFVHQYQWYPTMAEQWWPIDTNTFMAAEINFPEDALVRKLKEEGKKIVVFVGRFISEKGIEDLIQVFAKLDDSYTLLLIGGGKDQPLFYDLILQLQMQDRVHIIGPKPSRILRGYLELSDLLVLPSRTDYFWKEQYGRILVEAMAAKTLVLGSDSGAIPYVIERKDLIFPERNVEQLKEKIQYVFDSQMYSDTHLLQQYQQRSLQADPQHFIETVCRL